MRTKPNVGDPNFSAAEPPTAPLRPPKPPEMMGRTQHRAKGSSAIRGSSLLRWQLPARVERPPAGIWGLRRAGEVGRTGLARSPGPCGGERLAPTPWLVLLNGRCHESRTDVVTLASGPGAAWGIPDHSGLWGSQYPTWIRPPPNPQQIFPQNLSKSGQISVNLTESRQISAEWCASCPGSCLELWLLVPVQ